ncbi:hypothetical protein PG993_010261 [Apiospora rasikravindrae]|uniref:Uncharacterized protein n=1 Tax=Apiospora rasikravindrae TaxID=990691 RepID=A0ABR1SLQ3_9PEZI
MQGLAANSNVCTAEESMWISFRAKDPFMVKVYAGGVNAVSGEYRIEDANTKARRQQRHTAGKLIQDYIVVPRQLCLDGIAVSPGTFRQFEASSSGPVDEYSTKVLLSRESLVSDLQFEITPYAPFLRTPSLDGRVRDTMPWGPRGDHEVVLNMMNCTEFSIWCNAHDTLLFVKEAATKGFAGCKYRQGDPIMVVIRGGDEGASFLEDERSVEVAAGGTVRQKIVKDWHNPTGWETNHTITIPVHILHPDAYLRVTSEAASTSPIATRILDEAQSFGSLQSTIESKQNQAHVNEPNAATLELDGVVADPDDVVSRDGPFRPFRTLVDLEKELQDSEQPEM